MNDRGWSIERLVQRTTGLAGRGFRADPDPCSGQALFACLIWLKSLNFSPRLFRRGSATKQFSCPTKPFPAWAQTSGNRGWLQGASETAGNAGTKNRRQSNADPQLPPGLRFRAGSLGGRFVGQPAGCWHLRIQRFSRCHFTASGSHGCGQLVRNSNQESCR